MTKKKTSISERANSYSQSQLSCYLYVDMDTGGSVRVNRHTLSPVFERTRDGDPATREKTLPIQSTSVCRKTTSYVVMARGAFLSHPMVVGMQQEFLRIF